MNRSEPDHYTHVKFTGDGHQAQCSTPGCKFYGQKHSMIRYLAQGYTSVTAWNRTKTMAQDDARRHVQEERRGSARRR